MFPVKPHNVLALEEHVDVEGERGIAVDVDTQGFAHRAVCAVARDHVSGADRFLPAGVAVLDDGRHARIVLFERPEQRTVSGGDAIERFGPALDNGVEKQLRTALVAFGGMSPWRAVVVGRIFEAGYAISGKAGHIGDVHGVAGGPARAADFIRDTPPTAKFHRSRGDHVHFRVGDGAISSLDDKSLYALISELVRNRHSNRTAANDKHRHVVCACHSAASQPWSLAPLP